MAKSRRALVALGANLGNQRSTFLTVIERINSSIGKTIGVSRWYLARALRRAGAPLYPDFLNGVVAVETSLDPAEILEKLLEIEVSLGRIRDPAKRWEPRTIDLDLLALDGIELTMSKLVLPHPELQNRDFVLLPLIDVAPDWVHPRLGMSAPELLRELEARGEERYVIGVAPE